jgi:hypothetical protein
MGRYHDRKDINCVVGCTVQAKLDEIAGRSASSFQGPSLDRGEIRRIRKLSMRLSRLGGLINSSLVPRSTALVLLYILCCDLLEDNSRPGTRPRVSQCNYATFFFLIHDDDTWCIAATNANATKRGEEALASVCKDTRAHCGSGTKVLYYTGRRMYELKKEEQNGQEASRESNTQSKEGVTASKS